MPSKKKLEQALTSFHVSGKIVGTKKGPVITLYEFEPAAGIKASKIIGLAEDIARVMSAVSCRVSVIPGRNVVGIEVPNTKRKTVEFDELLKTPLFNSKDIKLPWAVGVDITGETVVVDIAKMPHLLMAGTTGSGKSVAMNTLICSLLRRLSPDECQFVMIDPKQLELSAYADIPHLVAPVITEPVTAVETLQWVVRTMEFRYQQMATIGVRNIAGYNSHPAIKQLPFIVVVIDEVADLMMVAGKEVEVVVQRLAQMARAAGIHLVMATQRPSVDVITGTVKANFPTRISFQVTSKIDSRTILGEQGAEQLLGMGDMLYMSGAGRMRRIHGAFVSDKQIAEFTDWLRDKGKPRYADAFQPKPEQATVTPAPANAYVEALAVVMTEGAATIGLIQRRLGIPYVEAWALVKRMEDDGLVSGADKFGNREVYIPR